MRTAAALVYLGTTRPTSKAALDAATEQLAVLTTARPLTPVRFTGFEPRDGLRVGRYEADYPDDAA